MSGTEFIPTVTRWAECCADWKPHEPHEWRWGFGTTYDRWCPGLVAAVGTEQGTS